MLISTFFDHIVSGARQRGISLSEAARLCLEAGVSGVEFLSHQYNDESLCRLRELKQAGMCVNGYPAFTDLIHDPSEAAVEEAVRRAAGLGARGILLVPGFLNPGEEPVPAMERSLPMVEKACRLAREEGMFVGMEDYDSEHSPVCGSEGLMWYLERVPALDCIFDTGNFYYMGEDTLSAYRRLRSRITRQVHLKDRSPAPRPCEKRFRRPDGSYMYPCAVGEGNMPIGEILADLADAGFDGSLTVELFGHPDCIGGVSESVRFIRKYFPEAGRM